MTYEEALNLIHSRKAFSTGGPSLERIRRLMQRLGNPQEQYRTVHVAGTNGKGSVSAMTASALRENGYKTGLFTSPYLVEFRERIQIDGEPISEEFLVSCFETVMELETAIEQEGFEPVNEFELVTAMGFVAFARAKVDYAVLEVGLGGRTDPTNLISAPAVACITPISLDHTAILGNTVAEIAGEKAGIIKPLCPTVVARQSTEATNVFLETAKRQQSLLHIADPVFPVSVSKEGSTFHCGNEELTIPLLGDYQMENAATAWKVCSVLGLAPEKTKMGFRRVVWPGRLQYFPGKPEILVDAGHNIAGVTMLTKALDTLFPGQSVIAVMAMMKDKDFSACIPMVARRSRMMIGTTVGLPRSMTPLEVEQAASPYCDVLSAPSVAEAIALAKCRAMDGELIVVCGSVYAAGAAVAVLE